jgi:hypothetical protein
MSLFGSDKVIIKMKQFIKEQNSQALNELAIAMRKDLYGIWTNLKSNSLDVTI